jgi:hypothetical protein
MILDFDKRVLPKETHICDRCNNELEKQYNLGYEIVYGCKKCSVSIRMEKAKISNINIEINECIFNIWEYSSFINYDRTIFLPETFPCNIKTLYEKLERILLLC